MMNFIQIIVLAICIYNLPEVFKDFLRTLKGVKR
ncbi:hypothetical protein LG52_2976 [Geobacillus kaustophilus]|uniref:Uncharacterized protein n=1 Tax=Geobacillus kaustophilus TaxID=1462 RepID=A0A0D8BVQ2_GEOKU|nr:hypothetical protein LG52_2976 [Geobacillus kaustophilus]